MAGSASRSGFMATTGCRRVMPAATIAYTHPAPAECTQVKADFDPFSISCLLAKVDAAGIPWPDQKTRKVRI
jgi:hypothetical protein